VAIVPANDPGALIVRARQLLDDDRERGRMAEAGQRLYIALFNAPLSAQVLRDERPTWNERVGGCVAKEVTAI